MSQNGQTHFKNLAANAARFLKCVWPFRDIMHERVKASKNFGRDDWVPKLTLRLDFCYRGIMPAWERKNVLNEIIIFHDFLRALCQSNIKI